MPAGTQLALVFQKEVETLAGLRAWGELIGAVSLPWRPPGCSPLLGTLTVRVLRSLL